MVFNVTHHHKYSIITLKERWIDMTAVKELKRYFIECKKEYVHRVILDLSSCEMLTSEGVGIIVSMWEFFRQEGTFFIVITEESIVSLFKECGLYATLQEWIFHDTESARAQIIKRQSHGFYVSGKSAKTCPTCGSTNIKHYDKGLRRLKRLLRGKKRRYVCRDCFMVWRPKR